MSNEAIISEFLKTAYTDEKLAALLAHAEDGRLSHYSCCCLAGVPSATHALRGRDETPLGATSWTHGAYHPETNQKRAASGAFNQLAYDAPEGRPSEQEQDAIRRTKLIPLIKAEMARREQGRSVESPSLETVTV